MRTDFILSAEIIAITLGTVQGTGFSTQLTVLSTIALLMTVGVYGLVAGIVKLDDGGLYLAQQNSAWQRGLGRGILAFAPWMMKTLSVVGTAAMFLVGGGILTHGWPALHHLAESITAQAAAVPGLSTLAPLLVDGITGVLAGAAALAVVTLVQKLRTKVAG